MRLKVQLVNNTSYIILVLILTHSEASIIITSYHNSLDNLQSKPANNQPIKFVPSMNYSKCKISCSTY